MDRTIGCVLGVLNWQFPACTASHSDPQGTRPLHAGRVPLQGHGQPGLDLTSSSLAAGDVYAHVEATKVFDALFP